MNISFLRTAMKKAVDVCKTLNKDKEKSKIWIKTIGLRDIFIYCSDQNKTMIYFHNLKTTEELKEEYSFSVNPYELETTLKGRDKVRTWCIEDPYTLKCETGDVKIEWVVKELPNFNKRYIDIENNEEFYEKIVRFSKLPKMDTNHFTLGSFKLSLRTDIYIKTDAIEESLDPIDIETNQLDILAKTIIRRKSDEKKVSYYGNQQQLILKFENQSKKEEDTFRQLYVINRSTGYPTIKQFDGVDVHTFELDAENTYQLVSKYPSAITDLYLYDWDGKLCIDPYDKNGEEPEENEDQPIHYIEYQGNIKRTKVDKSGFIALLEGYKGVVKFHIKKFEDGEETGYMLYTMEQSIYSCLIAKSEPNFEKLQKKVDKILEEQKKLKYI